MKKPAKKAASSERSKAKKKETPKTALRPPDVQLKVGQKAPSFSLQSDRGDLISLTQFAGKNVILFFYPRDLTPGCTQEACDFRDSYEALLARKAVVLGVSKDSVTSHVKFRDTHHLPFPLLSDPDQKTLSAYGAWREKSMYGRKFMGIQRMTFLIGGDGKIRRIWEKVQVKGHVAEIVDELK